MEIIIKGIKTNYIDEGEGDAVLFLQGWGTNLDLYKKLIEKVKENHRIIAFDFPGFGKTSEPSSAWDVDKYTDFTEELISKLKLSKVILMGHSFGGRVIIKLMSREKCFEVDKVILMDSAGIKPPKTIKKTIKSKYYKICKKLLSTKLGEKLFPGEIEKLQRKYGSADYRKASPLMKQVLVKVISEDLTELIPNINKPTLLIWGDLDTATPIKDGETMEKLIPDAGLIILKNTGHYSFLEDFYTFSKVLDAFLIG